MQNIEADGIYHLQKWKKKEGSNQIFRSAKIFIIRLIRYIQNIQNYRNFIQNMESAKYKADLNDARDNYNKGMKSIEMLVLQRQNIELQTIILKKLKNIFKTIRILINY